MYQGTLIKESLENDEIIDCIDILNVEIWRADNHMPIQPLFWTAMEFRTDSHDFLNELACQIKPYWYVDLSKDTDKILVLKDKVITYPKGSDQGREDAKHFCRQVGIPESQIDWEE